MVEPVGHRVDCILTKQLRLGTIVLHQMEAGFRAVFVVSVQGGPFRQIVGAQPRVEVANITCGDVAVVGNASGTNRLHDQAVHRIGGSGTTCQISRADLFQQPGVVGDQADDLIQPCPGGACRQGHDGGCRVDWGVDNRHGKPSEIVEVAK